jgi:hypothetical protein
MPATMTKKTKVARRARELMFGHVPVPGGSIDYMTRYLKAGRTFTRGYFKGQSFRLFTKRETKVPNLIWEGQPYSQRVPA